MKIESTTGSTPQLEHSSGAKPGAGKQAGSSVSSESGSSSLNISALSAQLHALEAQLMGGGSFDAGKVEAIKQAIRSGEFRVDSGLVADRLIQSVKELVGK